MELASLYKRLASKGPEINGLRAGMASFTLTSWNYYCLHFPLSNKGTQSSHWVHSPIPITESPLHLNVNASVKGPQPCGTRKGESKQMLICRARGTNCSWSEPEAAAEPGTARMLSGSRPSCGPLWRPEALKEFIHSTWVSNFLPSGYSPMADPITEKIDGSAWHAESTLVHFFS